MEWKYKNGEIRVFKKAELKKPTSIKIDSIFLLLKSYCDFDCPEYSLGLTSKENVYFHGKEGTEKIGFYKGKISKEYFNFIETKLSEANVLSLNKAYKDTLTSFHGVTLKLLIFSNDSIKTIINYGGNLPVRLTYALIPIQMIYKKLELEKVDTHTAKNWFKDMEPAKLSDFR